MLQPRRQEVGAAIREHHHGVRRHFGTLVILGRSCPPDLGADQDVEGFLGCRVDAWPAGAYTACALAGGTGEQLLRELAENARRIEEQIPAELRDPLEARQGCGSPSRA